MKGIDVSFVWLFWFIYLFIVVKISPSEVLPVRLLALERKQAVRLFSSSS